MADTITTPGTGAILGFDLVTLPDGTTNVFVARTKVGFGADGQYADVSATAPLPVQTPDISLTAAIDVTTLNTILGVPTAGQGGIGIEVPALAGGAVLTPVARTVAGGAWDPVSVVQVGTGLKMSTISAAGRFETTAGAKREFGLKVTTVGTGAPSIVFNLTDKANLTGVSCADPNRLLVGSTAQVLAPQVVAGAAATYAVGNCIGGILSTVLSSVSGELRSALVALTTGGFIGQLDLVLFSAAPTGGGVADNTAFVLTAADAAKVVAVLHLVDTTLLSTIMAAVTAQNLGQAFALPTTTLYFALIVRGAAVTLAGANQVAVNLQVVR